MNLLAVDELNAEFRGSTSSLSRVVETILQRRLALNYRT